MVAAINRAVLSAAQIAEVEEALPDSAAAEALRVELPPDWQQQWRDHRRMKESPTSIVTFLGCPLRWYAERHAPLGGEEEPSIFALAGTIVHRVLEVFYNEPAANRTRKLLLEVRALAWDAIETGNVDDGIVDEETVTKYAWIMDNHPNPASQQRFLHSIVDGSVMSVLEFDEQPAEVSIEANEVWLRATYNGVQINGKADRIVRLPTGALAIDDWKSGRPPRGEGTDVLDPTYVPAGIYAVMSVLRHARQVAPPEIDSVRLLYVNPKYELQRRRIRASEENLAKIDLLLDRVTAMMNAMHDAGAVLATPGASAEDGPCGYCPIKAACPAWGGSLDELAEPAVAAVGG